MLVRVPPLTTVSRHSMRFMASSGVTHGPPVLLQPGAEGSTMSMPSESASPTASLRQSFHSGVMYFTRCGTICGVFSPASKRCTPLIPTRCIHSRSLRMPSGVMLPFSQCHHT